MSVIGRLDTYNQLVPRVFFLNSEAQSKFKLQFTE